MEDCPKYCLASEVGRYVTWIGKRKAEQLVDSGAIRGWRLPAEADGRRPVMVVLDSVFDYVESLDPSRCEHEDREAVKKFLANRTRGAVPC